jgi:hypothetical protein
MTNQTLNLHVKAETATVPVKKEKHATSLRIPSEDNLLEVPASKATLSDFPPGCPVLHTDTSVVPLVVSKGKVESVFVDLTPGSPRQYFYKISLGTEKSSIISGEMQLQWAPHCPVWIQLLQEQEASGMEWKSAIIRGSYQEMADADPQYSVQEVEPSTGLYHGVTKDCIHYRHVDTDNSNEPPTAVVDSASMPPSDTQPASHEQTPAHKRRDNAVSCCVTVSPRKRPAPSEGSVTDDPAMGRCSAEFRIPMGMKALCLDGTCA